MSRFRGLRAGLPASLACVIGSLCAVAAIGADGPAFDPLADIHAAFGSPVTIAAVIEPGPTGAADVLAVTATVADGYHVYSLTQDPAAGPRPTVISVAAESPRRTAGRFVPDQDPQRHAADDGSGATLEEHTGVVTWRAPLEPGAGDVRGSVMIQACQRGGHCIPPATIAFAADAVDGDAAPAFHRPSGAHATLRAFVGAPEGDAARLVIDVVPDEGWHVYEPSASPNDTPPGAGLPTIVAEAPGSARVIRATFGDVRVPAAAESAGASAVDGPVRLELLVARDATADVIVGLHACSAQRCDPPFGVRVTARPPSAITYAGATYDDAKARPLPLQAAVTRPATPAAPAGSAGLTLPVAILFGLVGGLILNLMPCVLPVLGLKLLSFAQQSGRERGEVFRMNLWYCAGVYAVFFALATASVAANIGLASTNLGWGQQFQFVSFRIAMLGIVFAFALSFLGVWEIPIPGFIGEQAGHVQSKEGAIGSFLKGVLGTILATPCSGPFLGPVFGFTLSQPTAASYAVFGAIATGMALPYILVGLFPGLVRFLPRPGPWMATFKELLGFVMLGTVAYLFYMLRQQPEWFVPTFIMLVGIWMGCWWIGRLQERRGTVGFGRWVQGSVLAAAIGCVGFVWLGPHESLIPWEQPFSVERLAVHRSGGETVLVDFTADWCPTCKTNLGTAIETPEVAEIIQRNKVVPILADFTGRSPEIDRFLASMGARSIPFLVIFPGTKPGEPPRDPIVLQDAITKGQLIAALEEAGPSCCPPPEIRAASTSPAVTGR